jgi:HAE1 family hydrophobic/amphiphilic exporter-1
MAAHQRALAAIIAKEPAVDNFMSAIGPSGISTTVNTGRVFMRLKPRSERPKVDAIIQDLRKKLSAVPGMNVFLQNLPPIRIGGTLTKSQYQLSLQSPNTSELYKYSAIMESKLKQLKELQDVTSDLQISNPQVNLIIDRDKASSLGVTAQQVEDALYTAYSSRQVSTIFAPNNEYQVIMELEPRFQREAEDLSSLYVRSSRGALVPLGAVAKLERTVGPLTINHLGQIPAVTLSFNTQPGVSLGQAVALVQKATASTLPQSITASFQGTAQAFQSSVKGLGVLLIMAILVIYIVLGILYESFIHPLTILSGLPAAGFGALITLWLFGFDLNIYAFVGVIMLVGIVKKNAIMMIDFALEAERSEGKTPAEAIFQGCLIRFRPIMMTTMAALFGTLPIALGLGAGSESRRPLGLAVVGGLVFSQMITLYITPVVYIYLDKFQARLRRRRKITARGLVAGSGVLYTVAEVDDQSYDKPDHQS